MSIFIEKDSTYGYGEDFISLEFPPSYSYFPINVMVWADKTSSARIMLSTI